LANAGPRNGGKRSGARNKIDKKRGGGRHPIGEAHGKGGGQHPPNRGNRRREKKGLGVYKSKGIRRKEVRRRGPVRMKKSVFKGEFPRNRGQKKVAAAKENR